MVIHFPEEQQKRIEELAHERGYDNVADYLLALVDADEETDDLIDDPEQDSIDLEAEFREAWHAAMTGDEGQPVREMLEEIRRELEQDDD
jgi:hypothetical protein